MSTTNRPRDLPFYAEAIRQGTANDQHWITSPADVRAAAAAARAARETRIAAEHRTATVLMWGWILTIAGLTIAAMIYAGT